MDLLGRFRLMYFIVCSGVCGVLLSCGQSSNNLISDESSSLESSTPYIYVVSGSCYAGGLATSTASATITRFKKSTRAFDRLVIDYGSLATGDSPVAVMNYNQENLLVLVENAAGRRVDMVNKVTGSYSTWIVNATALNAQLRGGFFLSDGSLLISKSTAIEKFSSGKSRVLKGSNPFISAPGGSCATSTTLISALTVLNNGKILFAHAAASPNNKIGLISSQGYSVVADCLGAQSAPSTTALPTGLLMHSSGKLIVTYGSTTPAQNMIYSYNLDPDTNVFSSPVIAYNDQAYVYGPSAIIEDQETTHVYVANGANTHNSIEKFTFDSTTGLLTKITNVPFIGPNIFTRCVSGMLIAD